MVNWSKLEIIWDKGNENHILNTAREADEKMKKLYKRNVKIIVGMIDEVIKKWKAVSPKDVTSKPNWEEGWRLERGSVVKVNNLWGEAKIEMDKERLPEMEREIVATITEIEEIYERLRGFETLSGEDEEVRKTLVGIPNAIMVRHG